MKRTIKNAFKLLRDEGLLSLLNKSKIYSSNLKEMYNRRFVRNRLREINGSAADLYDCVIFWKELDMLKLRMETLNEIVDYFVVVEATESFQGNKKPLNFENNREIFSKFEDKIIYNVIEYPENIDSSWGREHYSRDSILQTLKRESDIHNQDEIILSDVDEIPDPAAIKKSIGFDGVKLFSQLHHFYYFNYVASGGSRWYGSIMSPFKYLTSPQDFKYKFCEYHKRNPSPTLDSLRISLLTKQKTKVIQDGGWHFSFIGDEEFIIDKLEDYAHTEFNNKKYKNKEKIREAMRSGVDFLGYGWEFEILEDTDRLPEYIQNNPSEFEYNFIKE